MKYFFCWLLLITAVSGNTQSSIDVQHYHFSITLSDSSDNIMGQALLSIKALSDISTIDLDFTTATNGKGMHIQSISTVAGDNTKITYAAADEKLHINLGAVLKKDSLVQLAVSYWGIPADGLIISKNKYGHRTFFADNWPNRGHNWLPCHDDPADKATVEFTVIAPQQYQVVANGIQMEESNLSGNNKVSYWKEDVPISTKVMVIGIAEFAVSLSGVIDNCIPVYSWVYPEDRTKGFYDYAQAAEILPWFIDHVGPYAYKKLANVQSKTTFGGLENANTIFYAENSVSGTRRSESLLAHEIAHQWFGNYATEKSFAHLWLSEGFATYMTILYLEQRYGADTAISLLKEDRGQAIRFGKNNPLPVVNNSSDYMSLLNANSYQKGGWVLHMLRRELGDVAFWKSIQLYYATYGGKTADTDDLRKIFEQVSGKKLGQFFKQWLYTAENPLLKITWKYQATEKQVSLTVEQLQPTPFSFPLELSLITEAQHTVLKTVSISKKTETFYLPVTSVITKVNTDPNTSLLFEASVNEIK